MPPRLHIDQPLVAGTTLALPPGAARHVQVLRLQPGAAVVLFNGQGGEWLASVERIGRSDVDVGVHRYLPVNRELVCAVTLGVGMPANERMDGLVEKATELGVAAIQPLVCERSVLRLQGERALKKVAHWQAVAVAASEQSGRTRVPRIAPVQSLREWLERLPASGADARLLLSPGAAQVLKSVAEAAAWTCLSGPEGGLTEAEQASALARGFVAVSLGPRVLRADTAPLALLARLGLARER